MIIHLQSDSTKANYSCNLMNIETWTPQLTKMMTRKTYNEITAEATTPDIDDDSNRPHV